MATVYIAPSPTGDDSRSYAQAQVISTPWATPEKTIASAVTGDAVIQAAGSYPVSTFLNINKLLGYSTASGRAVWNKGSSTDYVARTSGSAPAGVIRIANTDIEGANGVTQCFEVGDTSAGVDLVFDDVNFINGTGSNVFSSSNRGSLSLTNCGVSGGPQVGIGATSSLGVAEDYSISVSGLVCDLTAPTSAAIRGINLVRPSTATFAVNVSVDGVTGEINSHSSGKAVGVDLAGIDNVTVGGGVDFTVNSTNTSIESAGIIINGVDATATADNANLAGGRIVFNAPAGHGVQFGLSTADNFMLGGTISNWSVVGTYYASSTPHGITLGQGTTGSVTNSTVVDSYASFLISKTTTATVTGNTATNPYGVGFYAKGTTAATIDNNTVTIDGTQTQRELGLLTAIFQGGTDCTAATFSNNTILVADIAAINSLAMISQLVGDAGNAQPATFTNNTYIIPDTVDLNTELLFTRLGVSGQAANQTYAQWLANSEVTGDVVVQKSQAEILELIAGAPTPPTLTSPYSDLTITLKDILNIDITTAWEGATSYTINGLTYALEDVNSAIVGMVVDSGTRNFSIVAHNDTGSNSDSFYLQVLSGLPNKING